MTMAEKRILLIVGGGIAAYKSLELIRRLRDRGGAVRVILTRAGAEFVTPLSLAALSGNKVHTELFSLTDEIEMGHIELSRSADLVVVAPATADLMAKMAAGRADDLASTALLATDKPVLIAPAMNVRMWLHPATLRNLETLRADGVRVIGPNDGDMACGEFGPGRMAEPGEILTAIEHFFAGGDQAATHSLIGRKTLVTSGPTFESVDPVRFIANRSSGKQGHAIAKALADLGADCVLVSGPTALPDPKGVHTVHVESARDMLAACEAALPVDCAVLAAAVGDWRPVTSAAQKIKRHAAPPAIALTENPDILRTLSRRNRHRPALMVGFAAETENLVENATAKRKTKGCDWIVANQVGPGTETFGGDRNRVTLITASGAEDWQPASKADVARRLAQRIAEHLGRAHVNHGGA
jgi:phosphopantothenoylcysteine decarboxylase/phosphopantothenate--cysteine ligase